MRGTLNLQLRPGRTFVVIGGPSAQALSSTIFVKMAKEINKACDIDIPTPDFDTPPRHLLDQGLIDAVDLIVRGMPVYVGCMAGKGRTGLFLAILAKAFGIEKPVEYVREHYYPHAVETADQYEFVQTYEIPVEVRKAIKWARVKSYFTFRKTLTNLPSEVHDFMTAQEAQKLATAARKGPWPYA